MKCLIMMKNQLIAHHEKLNNDEKFNGVFIRAPAITDIGKAKPIAFCKNRIVGCTDEQNMALTFHPELTENNYFHKLWLRNIS